jgi:hypothetical protein
MNDDAQSSNNYVVFGPMNVGKTALLGALQVAARNRVAEGGDLELDVVGTCTNTRALFKVFGSTVLSPSGTLPIDASHTLTRYRFRLVGKRRRRVLGAESIDVGFDWIDGPGGATLPVPGARRLDDDADDEVYRTTLVEALCACRGFILCVDPTQPDDAAAYCIELPALMEEVAQRRTTPLERAVVCLTKADKLFAPHGTRAMGQALTRDPAVALEELLTPVGMSTLRRACRKPTRLGAVWTSVFGFVQKDGASNLDPVTGGLLLRGPQTGVAAAMGAWRPFQVLDPFLFAATGRADGVVEIAS